MRSRIIASTLSGLILAANCATAGLAQSTRNCAPRAIVVKRLGEKFNETRQSIGLGANNTVVEVFAADTGTWSITVTTPNGITCLVASGQAFEALAESLPAKGSDA